MDVTVMEGGSGDDGVECERGTDIAFRSAKAGDPPTHLTRSQSTRQSTCGQARVIFCSSARRVPQCALLMVFFGREETSPQHSATACIVAIIMSPMRRWPGVEAGKAAAAQVVVSGSQW